MNPLISRVCVLGLVLAATLSGVYVLAQSTSNADAADKSMKSVARVNPTTLAMEFSIPLITYPGRGGTSLPVSLEYSSKVWELHQLDGREDDYFVAGVRRRNHYRSAIATYSTRSNSGWTTTLDPPKITKSDSVFVEFGEAPSNSFVSGGSSEFGEHDLPLDIADELLALGMNWPINTSTSCSSNFYNGLICTTCRTVTRTQSRETLDREQSWCEYWGGGSTGNPMPQPTPAPRTVRYVFRVKRINVEMPGGSIVEFRMDDRLCSMAEDNDCFSRSGSYLAVDGSRMRLEIQQLQADGVTKKDILYMPSGERYIFGANAGTGAEATERIDANGNRLLFDRTLRQWTDTLGRTIKSPLTPNTVETPLVEQPQQLVTLPGMGSGNLQYQLTWKKLKRPECESSVDPNCGDSALENAAQELAYSGSNTCSPMWTGQQLTPALFEGHYAFQSTPIIEETKTLFCGGLHGSGAHRFNPVVLSGVLLPDGSRYEFRYNRFGELTKIIYPTGSTETFTYESVDPIGFGMDPTYQKINRGVVHRVIDDGEGNTQSWTYVDDSIGSGLAARKAVKTVAPDGSKTLRAVHRTASEGYGFEDARSGLPFDERSYDVEGNLKLRKLTKWVVNGPLPGGYHTANRDPRPVGEVSLTIEGDKAIATASRTTYDSHSDPKHFAHLNAKRVTNYHYLSFAPEEAENKDYEWFAAQFDQFGQVSGAKESDYSYDGQYLSRGINGLITEVRVLNPSDLNGPPLSKTQTVYDNALPGSATSYPYSIEIHNPSTSYDCSTDPQTPKVCWQSPGGQSLPIQLTYRGLPTTSRIWYAEGNTWIETHNGYDQFGNVVKTRDSIGNEASTAYDPLYKYAYPTTAILPGPDPTDTHGSSQPSITKKTYDFTTGLTLTVEDDFGQVTRTIYDNMLRPRRVFPENFTAAEIQTIYGKPDSTSGQFYEDERFVTVRKQLDESRWDVATTRFDRLGRVVRTEAMDSEGDVFVTTEYDNMGRVSRVTNPYRTEDAIYWSKVRYDAAGRLIETYAPVTEPNLANAPSLGTITFELSALRDFLGTVVTTKDASGRRARTITNALGQLIRVDEATSIGGTSAEIDLGSLAAPHQPTVYTYDGLGKLVRTVQQLGETFQKRYFKYDSLGRLIRVNQPEQVHNPSLNLLDSINTSGEWTAGFLYDNLGNVIRSTNANGVHIVNEYDRAGRLLKRCYTKPNVISSATSCDQIPPADASIDTSTVWYLYDGKGLSQPQSPNYAKGKLTLVENGTSQTLYTHFDNFGRLKQAEQRTPVTGELISAATPRVSKYTYDLAGSLIQEEYPSGRIVKTDFESDGDVARVSSRAASNQVMVPYATNLSYSASGHVRSLRLGNGWWETTKLNPSEQVVEIGLGGAADPRLWKLTYDFGELDAAGGVNAQRNTGNIARQTLSFAGLPHPIVQTFEYDSLYRLKKARETTNDVEGWSQTYDYDRFGNRIGFSQDLGGLNVITSTPSINPATNRFNPNQGFDYDKNGNLVADVDETGQGRTFVYNGDNKQTEVRVNSTTASKYFYDGEGNRVKKIVGTEETVFVYSAGKLVAEYSTQLPSNPSVSYTTMDSLGSPRLLTDRTGQVIARRDFLPFGEEVLSTTGPRAAISEYSTSELVRQKFTGYLKDNETNLYFAEARMYENRYGRFTTVDPLLASGRSGNPQTFNRYLYVGNRPISITDPTGLDWFRRRNGRFWTYQYSADNRTFSDGTSVEGWDLVDFGSFSNLYLRVDNICVTADACDSTRYLGRYGGSLTPEQYGARQEQQRSLANFFGTYSPFDPKQLAVRDSRMRDAASDVMWSGAAILNKPSETFNLFAGGINYFGGNVPFAPTITPDENTRGGGSFFYYGTNVGFLAQGGASLLGSVRSGVNSFRAGGSTFGERLFNSATFGKESRLFGNKFFDSTGNRMAGSLNQPGSRFKAGWSSVSTERSILDKSVNMAQGGGQQFRIGLGRGTTPNQARYHFYVPKSFVPNSYANQFFVP